MAFNPLQILKLKDALGAFKKRHPGFSGFMAAVRSGGIPEGSVLDLRITDPDGKTTATNFRVSQEDIELIRMLGELRNG